MDPRLKTWANQPGANACGDGSYVIRVGRIGEVGESQLRHSAQQ
jgi:hypothetical protein